MQFDQSENFFIDGMKANLHERVSIKRGVGAPNLAVLSPRLQRFLNTGKMGIYQQEL